MKRLYDLKILNYNDKIYYYFIKREKNDINGNPRYKVIIIDSKNATAHEVIFKQYESLLEESIKNYLKREGF